MCRLSLFITRMAHFSMPNAISMNLLYILIVCIKVNNSFSFLAKSLMSSLYIMWLIFSCDLLSLFAQPAGAVEYTDSFSAEG